MKRKFEVVNGVVEYVGAMGIGNVSDKGIATQRDIARVVAQKNNLKKECVYCGESDEDKLDLHHIDTNRTNARLNNLIYYCGSCHKKEHAKLKRIAKFHKEVEVE